MAATLSWKSRQNPAWYGLQAIFIGKQTAPHLSMPDGRFTSRVRSEGCCARYNERSTPRSFASSFLWEVIMLSRQYQCPDCGGSDGYRSRRRNLVEKYFLPLMMMQPVRCMRCYR